MKRRTYTAPFFKIHQLAPHRVICGSDDEDLKTTDPTAYYGTPQAEQPPSFAWGAKKSSVFDDELDN